MHKENTVKTSLLGLLALTIMTLAGCVGAPVKTPTAFFPPAPEEPRLQYLKGISGSKDVEVPESGMAHSLKVFATGEEAESKPIVKPFGVRYANGNLYVCDPQGHSIAIIDVAKNVYSKFFGNGSGKLKKPLNLAVDSDGSMYVLDVGRHNQVVHFDAHGDFVSIIDLADVAKETEKDVGKDGESREIKAKAVDVAVDAENVYVLDMTGGDIKVFDKKTEKHLRNIGGYVEGQGGLAMPSNMAIGPDGFIYVNNIASGSVVILDKAGKVISHFGKLGDGFGDFARPKGIAVDSEGRIWVVDGGLQNVQLFQGSGKHRLLINFGDPGFSQGSLNLPVGITLTTENLEYWQQYAAPGFVLEEIGFVTNQAGPTKISIYGLGHRAKQPGEKTAEPAPVVEKK